MTEVENLTKYCDTLAAITNMSFKVEGGEILGFLGPNAAGKTATMCVLTGFFSPSSGTTKVGELDVLEDSLDVRRRIGCMPDMGPLYPEMTVSSCLRFIASVRDV